MNANIYAFADEASAQIDEQIVAMKKNDLLGLEIRNVDGVNVSEISLAKAREVKTKLDAAGLITWSIGSPIGKIDIEKGDFKLHIEKFKRTIEIADALDCKNIRLFSFYIPKDADPKNYRNEVIERMGVFCDVAKGSPVVLCHENEKGIYGDNAERALEIVQQFPMIKNIFDPANFVQCGQDTLEAWAMLKDYTKYLHIKDALADGKVVPAGAGVGNVAQIVKEYMAMGGRDFTIEPHLTVFDGLKALENEEVEKSVAAYQYPSKPVAFDVAVNSFKSIL